VHLVGGVDGHEHRADLDRRPEGYEPLRYVRRPDRHVVAALDAHRDQRAREQVHVVAELGVGARVVARRVAERKLVRELLDDAVEHLRERQVDQVLLGPGVLAGSAVVGLKALGGVGLDEVREVREHDARVGQVRHPPLDPLERHEAVVVALSQAVEHAVDRQVALAHHLVDDAAVLDDGVLRVHVADVAAEVLNGRLRLLMEEAVRVVDVPERGDLGPVHAVEQFPEPRGVRVDAVRLDQELHALALRAVGEQQKGPRDLFVVDLALGLGLAVREHAYVRSSEPPGELDVLGDLEDRRLAVGLVLERRAGGKAGNRKSQIAQFPDGLVDAARRKRGGGHSVYVAADATNLDAVKLKVLCHRVDVDPVEVRTSNRRKGDSHWFPSTSF